MARKGLTKYKAILCENGDSNCHYCNVDLVFGKKQRSPDFATVDHVDAFSNGGQNKLSNFVLACMRCNSMKGSMSYEEYSSKVKSVEDRENYYNESKKKTNDKKEQRNKENILKMANFLYITNIKIDLSLFGEIN